MDNTIEQLMKLINKIVNEQGKSWNEKRDYVNNNLSDDEKSTLAEFCGWFE